MLSRTVPLKRTVSCSTKPIWPRSPCERVVAEIDAIDQHAARCRDRRSAGIRLTTVDLPPPVGADDPDELARLDSEVDVLEHRRFRIVGESHMVEDDLALSLPVHARRGARE